MAESCVSTLKMEFVHHVTFLTRAAVHRTVFDYIEVFDNRRRRYSTLGDVSPAEYERVAARAA